MNAVTKTRTQRRMEKKQTLILLVLVLAVALASFVLGVYVGRRGAERDLAQKQFKTERILVTKAPQAVEQTPKIKVQKREEAVAPPKDSAAPAEETKLTFYDNLAKEESVPLGSGINLPPQPEKVKKPISKPPIALPEQPIVKKEAPVPVAVAKVEEKSVTVGVKTEAIPEPDADGTYAVQVGSFASAADAGTFKKKLQSKKYPAFVAEADLGAKGLWYRVKIGPYAAAETAKTVQQLIEKKEQIKGFVSRK